MAEDGFLNPAKVLAMAGMHEGMQVADLGAGAGFFTRAAGRLVGEAGVVWAVDSQQGILSRIKNFAEAEGLHNVEVLHGDIETAGGSNLPTDYFDFVIAANILFAVENKAECVAEIRRVMKKSGRALVIDWAGSFGGLGPHPSHVVTAAAAEKLFTHHGLQIIGKVHAGAYHWGFVVRKKSS